MEKNLIIAVALSMLVYLGWFSYVDRKYPKPIPASSVAMKTAQTDAIAAPASEFNRSEVLGRSQPVTLSGSEVKINPRGAGIASYQYRGPLAMIELVDAPEPGFYATWPELTFKAEAGASAPTFTATRPDGARIVKEFLPEGEATQAGASLPRLRITISNPTKKPIETGAWTVALGPGLGTVESEKGENAKNLRVIGLTPEEKGSNGKVDVLKPGERALSYRWVAVDNRYFLAAAIPNADEFDTVATRLPPQLEIKAKNFTLQPGAQRAFEIPYYLGAKGNTWLTRYHAGLERSINFGFFSQVGRKILAFLNFIHERTGNWGWSIILLTIILQLALSPLTYKSLRSAAAMKKLQPEIAKLQQRYSKDPTRLNAEMMDLYKKTGANPLGGCLPMVVQMPVFIALFNTLRNAWELHGAPWAFWIKDLSSKDPFYVLPLVMGGLMFAQNKLNPPTTDPNQAMMMNVMPIMFTVMFLRFPSGLVLYWLTNSIMSALQQLALKRHFERTV